jgi:hypothetical protein
LVVVILVFAAMTAVILLRTLTGQESNLAVVASTSAITTLFQPLRRRFQGFIDRRFYRRKYKTDLDTLGDHVLTVINGTMQSAHVSLWLRPSQEILSGEDAPPQAEKR